MSFLLSTPKSPHISIAPMMGWTDKHDRYFLRLISPHVRLYTVMITTGALIHGQKYGLLEYNEEEHPLALQLGGSNPQELAACAKIAEQQYRYDEINLNCGCPSDRVQRGKFGACLMAEPQLVADCVDSMRQATSLPITVKTRIGIDHQESYNFLTDFVGTVAEKGCGLFIIHARKAYLQGLSPADNRNVPPLKYDTVYRLKKDFPHLTIILNGGLKSIESIQESLCHVDGVMIGREAYQNPYFLAEIEKEIFKNQHVPTRAEVIDRLIPYIEKCLSKGIPLKDITRHILGLWQHTRGARQWRRTLSEDAYRPGATVDVVRKALNSVHSD